MADERSEPRRHESPNPETGKSIVVIEDETLPANWLRVECAHSDRAVAELMPAMFGDETFHVEVLVKKGHPRHKMHMVVGPADYEHVVALVEDDGVTAMTDAEFASEVMRATRRNN